MHKTNLVREALGLSKTQAGNLFTGQTGKSAYDTWSRWERTGKWLAPAEKLFNVILTLKMAQDHKTKNCHGSLQLVLKMLENTDDNE